jgi:hypothetical protein
MGAMARVAIAGCGLLALTSCSGGAGSAAPPTAVTAPSTAVTTVTSTLAPSTTSAPTTTLSPKEPRQPQQPQQQDEAQIRALHDRFFRMLALTGDPPNPDHPEIAATTTGIQNQRTMDVTSMMRELGEHTEGSISGTIVSIDLLDEAHAAVTVCTMANSSRYSAAGQVLGTDPSMPWLTELRLLRLQNGWRVEDWFVGGDQPCNG